ncbi:hypothetical protein ACSYDW_17675 [Paeniglutamicibacter sp. R2-26]|uniref:hypothetical protein n=1 Tax=Paeniglutamicibacter sp. R2-26 TaxID=3144417 RepID=UPI003EE5E98B
MSTQSTSSEGPKGRDPFADIEDQPKMDTLGTRLKLFTDAKRGYVRIRKDFVQRESEPRASVLADFVHGRKERALDLFLTIHALQPILEDTPLPIATWARLLDSTDRPCTTRAISSALRSLQTMKLLKFEGPKTTPVITLYRENADETLWTKEWQEGKANNDGRGFFTIPFDYWTDGTIDELRLPGKAMLLILLKETQDPNGPLTFTMPVQRASSWYGISERTAERGYLELAKLGLIAQRVQKIPDARHPAGRREVHHRAPIGSYSTDYREYLGIEAKQAASGGD